MQSYFHNEIIHSILLKTLLQKSFLKVGFVAVGHHLNPTTSEAEAGGCQI